MNKAQELDLLMVDPPPGSHLKMKLVYPGSPKSYVYVAISLGTLWYLSGISGSFPSWASLVNWMQNKNAEVISIQTATSWEDLL
jgi:hypothetical protein